MLYFVRLVSDDSLVAIFFDKEVADHYVMHQFTFMEDLKIIPISQNDFSIVQDDFFLCDEA